MSAQQKTPNVVFILTTMRKHTACVGLIRHPILYSL